MKTRTTKIARPNRRIALDDLEAASGLPAPAQNALQTIGAFRLDVGEAGAQYPLQLAIPVQAGIDAQPGEELLFLRKGSVLQPDGSHKDTWWLVDNGSLSVAPLNDAADATQGFPVCYAIIAPVLLIWKSHEPI